MLDRRLPLLLVNRNAGRVEDGTADQVASLLRKRGSVEVVVTSEPDEAEPAIAALDGRMLVIAGGDGTVHDALNGRSVLPRLAPATQPEATSSPSAAARCASSADPVATTPTGSSGTTSPT